MGRVLRAGSPRFEAERAAGRELYPEFSDLISARPGADRIALVEEKIRRGLIPALGPFERTPGSTSIRYHHGCLYCLQETGYAFVLDMRVENGRLIVYGHGRLETWAGEWEGPFAAHPRIDPGNGGLHNISVAHGAELVVIDARTMTELARLYLPQCVPCGVHATWLDTAEIATRVAAKTPGTICWQLTPRAHQHRPGVVQGPEAAWRTTPRS